MRYHLTIMRPEGPASFYVQAFHELVETLAYGLSALGHDVSFRSNVFMPREQNIVLAAQFADPATAFPEGTVLYNLEQLGANEMHLISPGLTERCRIWEYSPKNMEYWRERGTDADLVPVGYSPPLTRIAPMLYPDIDVLFYGSVSPRRAKIIRELQEVPGLKFRLGVSFGSERDPLIARSKVVLNMHYYEAPQLFEQVRVSYLLANRKAVVCEASEDFPPALAGTVRLVPYDELVQACRDLVTNVEQRLSYQSRGYELFSRMRETDILRPALRRLAEKNSHNLPQIAESQA